MTEMINIRQLLQITAVTALSWGLIGFILACVIVR